MINYVGKDGFIYKLDFTDDSREQLCIMVTSSKRDVIVDSFLGPNEIVIKRFFDIMQTNYQSEV